MVIINKILRNHGYNEQKWIFNYIMQTKMAFNMEKNN